MVRKTAKTTTESITNPEDVEVGDTVDISGRDFLPKSNLEVVDVDPEWADDERYDDARVFTARIPNRSNARDYTFKVSSYGTVVTTNSRGVFDNYALEATKIVEVDEDDTDDEDDDVIVAAEDPHGHKHEAEEVGDDAIVIRETFDDGSTSRLYLRADGPLDLDYEAVRVGDDDTVGIKEVFPDGSSSYHSVPTEVYEAIADRVAHFVDDPEADEPEVATDGGRDYADAKDDEVDVVREALRDATDDDLAGLFGPVADHAREADDTPARVDVVVVPAMVARKGLRHGFGAWHFGDERIGTPGDGGERVVFHVHRDDGVHDIRNRVLQALTPTDPPRHA